MKKVVGASSGYSLHRGVITHRPRHFWGMRLLGIGVIIAAINLGVGFYQPFSHAPVSNQKQSDAVQLVASHDDTAQMVDATAPSLHDMVAQAVDTSVQSNSAQNWSVAVYDLDANQWLAQFNADQQMESASTYKLFMAYALSKTKPFEQWGVINVEGHTVKDCVDLMLRVSDNPCGEAIGKYVGWGLGDRLIHANGGYAHTKLNAIPGPLTTAADTAQFMVDLYQNKLFDAQTQEFIMSALKNQKYRSAIPAGCSGCSVHNKTGNSAAVAHDVAIVDDGKHHYVVSIMSETGTYQKIANIERAIEAAMRAN